MNAMPFISRYPVDDMSFRSLTLLGPQSRFGDNSLGIRLVCPQTGTAVLKVLAALQGIVL